MRRLVCGIFDPSDRTSARVAAAGRARDLTVSWLRWGYFGDILEDTSLESLLSRALDGGYRYCLVQGYGHILAEHSGPSGGRSRSFFEALDDWIQHKDFVFAGNADRCLLVDLQAWASDGRPACDGRIVPLRFNDGLEPYLLDLQPDLSAGANFLKFLDDLCEKAGRGVFVLNYESYDDIPGPPPGFAGPVSTLYCVAAGLKPNRILQTHGFDGTTRVVFFDYSSHALHFRRKLNTEWQGRDYPGFLRSVFADMPPDNTHYYLWPGASADTMDWSEMDRLWRAELARWGGARVFEEHWQRFRALRHEYLLCNILEPSRLLERIKDESGAVIWWSNAFSTVYTATQYSLDEKRRIYERWIRLLARNSPRIFIYGSDHSNSSVNALNASDYQDGYFCRGGDPLLSRAFNRHEIRF